MAEFYINFNSNGGTYIPPQLTENNSGISVPDRPNKAFHSFTGWYADKTLKNRWDFIKDKATKNLTLYAGWHKEEFQEEDKPAFEKNKSKNYMIRRPWNYDQEYNQLREYPLIISLHGSTKDKDYYMIPEIYNDEILMQKDPFFFFAPNANTLLRKRNWKQASNWLIKQIESIKKEYRINPTRIYLIGFSMGGSGSYYIANEYLEKQDQLFAGIIRVAGKSEFELHDKIIENTSIWYHVGLSDSNLIQNIANMAFNFEYESPLNKESILLEEADTFELYKRTTQTIQKNNFDIFKISKYSDLGHSPLPLEDVKTVQWLLQQ